MTAYYNEFDPFAAQWIRELIKAGLIAPGEVDERSIEDVVPADIKGFTQCHFFAGIGVWSYALRRSGWADDRQVWTGSCPCQPFSTAGKGNGFDDERHLWPAFHHLIEQCRPPVIFGEQVASKAVDDWIDLVHADLEAVGYAFGSVPFPSAGVGAPHIRDRNFWMAESASDRCAGGWQAGSIETRSSTGWVIEGQGADQCWELSSGLEGSGVELPGRMAHPNSSGWSGASRSGESQEHRIAECGMLSELADSCGEGLSQQQCDRRIPRGTVGAFQRESLERSGASVSGVGFSYGGDFWRDAGAGNGAQGTGGNQPDRHAVDASGSISVEQPRPSPTDGFWRDADWLFCRDGKWRPVEPGTFPLVDGASARVGRLRGYGNAINAEAAQEFIKAYMNTRTTWGMFL